MEDAVRPSKKAFKAMYERGYRTWLSLYEKTTTDINLRLLIRDSHQRLESVLLHYPAFPDNLDIDRVYSNTAYARGKSTWNTSQECPNLPLFKQDVLIPVASDYHIKLTFLDAAQSENAFSRHIAEHDDHITLLVLAWSYVLSARWGEAIPEASMPIYTKHEAEFVSGKIHGHSHRPKSSIIYVDLGDVDDEAARWWSAVLCSNGGWKATMTSAGGGILYSPWSVNVISDISFVLSSNTKYQPLPAGHGASSFSASLCYLSNYCQFHNINEQSQAALAATILLPVARFDNSTIQLPVPLLGTKPKIKEDKAKHPKPDTSRWDVNLEQLDRLLALSCNAIGVKSLLASVFYEPGVECNTCGAWLQGMLALLDSDILQDQKILLQTLIERDPSLGYLWIGAFAIGAHRRLLKVARHGWWRIDLHVAAWTGTSTSFIQEPVAPLVPEADEITRADECRLLYICHEQEYPIPPLFPFGPFGASALTDTNVEVREHALCQTSHVLECNGVAWRCREGQLTSTIFPSLPLRSKNGNSEDTKTRVPYDKLNNEEDACSEMVTRNIFCWLRGEDGFPVAERSIREHEWIDNLDLDDGSPITGDATSTAGGNLHGWLLKTMTKRSNSL